MNRVMRSGLLFASAVVLTLGIGTAHAEIAVKLGVMSDMSGLFTDIGGLGSVEAAKLAVEDFGPAANGMTVEIISADHLNKPDVGSAIARQWYDAEHVDAIADVPTSSVVLAVSEVTREKGKVLLVSGSGTSDLTGKACSPNTIHWTYDTWGQAHSTASTTVALGGDTWFFITADYNLVYAMERDAAEVVKAAGGRVLGAVRAPLSTTDYSSFLLQAQASKAKIIGLASGGPDTTNAIKQAAEFGLVEGGQKLAAFFLFLSDTHALGLQAAHGLTITVAYYWDLNDKTRAFAQRLARRNGGKYPTHAQAGVYSAVLHYLEAVKKVGSAADGTKVVAAMKGVVYDDPLFGNSVVREDGRALHDMYLVEVKKPSESKGPYDYYKVLATIPADKAFRPLKDGGCPLIK